jgi:hypothetical protein
VLLGIHGIGKHHLGRHQLQDDWRPALADGLERVTGRAAPPALEIAFYGDLFRPDDEGEPTMGVGSWEDDVLGGIGDEEFDVLAGAVGEIVMEEDLAVAAATVTMGYTRVPARLATLLGALERRFPATSAVLTIGVLRQVLRYLTDAPLKAAIDARVAEWAAGPTAIIAHSLGSVVGYEYLRQHPDHPVELFLTLGSPLGLRMTRSRLEVEPLGATRWTNLRDPRDPVTCAGDLAHWWPQIDDVHVSNSIDAHSVTQYLGRKQCGEALLRVLPDLAP